MEAAPLRTTGLDAAAAAAAASAVARRASMLGGPIDVGGAPSAVARRATVDGVAAEDSAVGRVKPSFAAGPETERSAAASCAARCCRSSLIVFSVAAAGSFFAAMRKEEFPPAAVAVWLSAVSCRAAPAELGLAKQGVKRVSLVRTGVLSCSEGTHGFNLPSCLRVFFKSFSGGIGLFWHWGLSKNPTFSAMTFTGHLCICQDKKSCYTVRIWPGFEGEAITHFAGLWITNTVRAIAPV